MTNFPHVADSYFDETAGKFGRFILPAGAAWTQVVYRRANLSPQTCDIVRLAGESDAEAGAAWAQEYALRYAEAVDMLICSDDDEKIQIARDGHLVLDARNGA